MNAEHTAKLFQDFPYIYRGRKDSPKGSLMCFGFSCGDGWYSLIYELSASLEKHVRANYRVVDVEVKQVKEKFGSLRFYISGGDEYVHNLITEAEMKSAVTCENCGQPGKLHRIGWLRTLCDLCAFQDGYDDENREEEGHEESVEEQDGSNEPILETGMKRVNKFTCKQCGWVGFVNDDPQYAKPGWRCFRCGVRGKDNFHPTKEGECPIGVTIQQINCEEEE